ncbi:DUF3710 domain-containing protein [Arthrobacter sp. AET 35A]|uniref:DUF3710 domain-containing protein n=1 Tax=Arthrobacter sp. 147(2020) TaxID=2735318 RepID=UPI00149187DE|nr:MULTISPECIES: DUF3710 domain-containing protein [unclassified Arthrobacter]MBE0009543.1 DUF3710 domain-containing protein [Arthrobacter sp. AET 35A]NOJ63293.1 DUF3710 domain-containing protein [Arthrobacter sp. 147(2020)]
MVFGRLKKKQENLPAEEAKPAASPVEEQVAPASAAATENTTTEDTTTADTIPEGATTPTDAPEPATAADGTAAPVAADDDAELTPAAPSTPAAPAPGVVVSRDNGPFDVSEHDSDAGYIDLGALRIGAAEGLQLRLEVEEKTKRVIAVTLDLNGSNLQLQAFAAPRTDGLWDEIRAQIGVSVGSQGGTVQDRVGTFGTELVAKLPAKTADGQPGFRVARFLGVDGPRWFLRGVIGGPAAINKEAAAPIEELFRKVVVVRGDHPLPPRELLQLRLPKESASARPTEPVPPAPDLTDPLKRGPEITHIG